MFIENDSQMTLFCLLSPSFFPPCPYYFVLSFLRWRSLTSHSDGESSSSLISSTSSSGPRKGMDILVENSIHWKWRHWKWECDVTEFEGTLACGWLGAPLGSGTGQARDTSTQIWYGDPTHNVHRYCMATQHTMYTDIVWRPNTQCTWHAQCCMKTVIKLMI